MCKVGVCVFVSTYEQRQKEMVEAVCCMHLVILSYLLLPSQPNSAASFTLSPPDYEIDAKLILSIARCSHGVLPTFEPFASV